jgi:MFS family permease
VTPEANAHTDRPGRVVRATVGAITTTVVSVVPVFLVGGLAVQIGRDVGLTRAGLGAAVGVYFGATALGSLPVGRLVERYGSARTGRAAVVLSGAAMLAIALAGRSVAALLAMLAVAATANSLGQLASNASLAHWVPPRRHGLTFGAKQSAIPLSTLLAGAAVPAVALTLGWRWAFGIAAALALAVLPLVPPDPPGRSAAPLHDAGRPGAALVLLGVAAALGGGVANALSAFLVDSAVARGVPESSAGLMLALGSSICVCARLLIGWLADRRDGRHLGLVAGLLACGGLGVALLGVPGRPALVAGVLIGFGLGWSWPGLLAFAVVRRHPRTPAAATSITQTGVYAGASVGPLGFGLLATHASYPVAWLAAGVAMLAAAAFVLLGARLNPPAAGYAPGADAAAAPTPGHPLADRRAGGDPPG